MHSSTTAHIDLAALRANFATVRRLCPRSRIMAMVKADAYGHGLLPVAQALAAADGLAVARLEEAMELREAGLTQRILLLGTLLGPADLEVCLQQSIDVTVHDATSLGVIASRAARPAVEHQPLRVWLELDAGMHRMGLDPAAFIAADKQLRDGGGVAELVHMTHFSSADDPDPTALNHQLARFSDCHAMRLDTQVSLANSAALTARPDTHGDWVRPGIMLYGGGPASVRAAGVRPVMRLVAPVLAVRAIAAGERVGYDGCWTAARPSRIATIGIGYGDGYPRHAPNGTPVSINGKVAPLVGRVSMDSIGVDVTDCAVVAAGDEAVLWGPQLPAADVARPAGTIDYALFTGVSPRVRRVYAEG